jgi:hypothetical protein
VSCREAFNKSTAIFAFMAEREGLLAATPLVLRFAPDRRSCAASSKIAFDDFVEPPFPYLGLESPLRGCHDRLIETDGN